MYTFLAVTMLMVKTKNFQFLYSGQLTDRYVLQFTMKLHLKTGSIYLCLCSTFVIMKSNQKVTSYSIFQKLIQLLEGSLPFRNLYMGEQLSFWGKNCNPKHELIFILCDVKIGHVLDFVAQNTALKSEEEMELRQCSDCFHEAFASLWS